VLKPFAIAFAWISVGWGILAAIIPLVPTTPFVLLGLYILTKYDPRMAWWLKRRIVRGRSWWARTKLRFSPV
jgi:uncharacterized membrane protein YbaN (DUF454 family)